MERNYSKAIADSFINHLKKDDYDGYQFNEKKGIIYFNASIDCPIDTLMYKINIYSEGYVVHALLPLKIPMKAMGQMNWFVSYANNGLLYGNFELDPVEGDISFKFPVTCTGGVTPPEEMIEESLFIPFIMMKEYIPGIINVFFGKMDGEEACKRLIKFVTVTSPMLVSSSKLTTAQENGAAIVKQALAGGTVPNASVVKLNDNQYNKEDTKKGVDDGDWNDAEW